MIVDVTAKYNSDSVKFTVEAKNMKDGLAEARKAAKEIFGATDKMPTVSIKQAKPPKE